jgi:hypothetical protein
LITRSTIAVDQPTLIDRAQLPDDLLSDLWGEQSQATPLFCLEVPGQEPLVAVRFPLVNGDLLADVGRGRRMMLSFKLRNNADWRQPFMLPTTDLTGAALHMRLGTLDLSTSNGRIVIDDPTVGAFSFVVPAG